MCKRLMAAWLELWTDNSFEYWLQQDDRFVKINYMNLCSEFAEN